MDHTIALTPPGSDNQLFLWRFADVEFDESGLELRVAGKAVEIEHKPLQLLAFLLRHSSEVVSKQDLLQSVWAGRVTVEHVVATAVGKLRRGLGAAADRVVTVPRIGYRLLGPVERIAVGREWRSGLSLRVGSTVPGRDHFQLQRRLGSGQSSEVWLARHRKTAEQRVYKFARDARQLDAIKRESTVARLLASSLGGQPGYVRTLDWNFDSPPFFLESVYAGQPLEQWVIEAGLASWPVAARLDLFLQACDAVAAAHSVGILHKDLKPSNILVAQDSDGQLALSIADFGCARLLDPQALAALNITALGFTRQGQEGSSGTPLYLAPEVIAGREPTVQSDVYALGILLYQLLCGDCRRIMAGDWERDISDPLLREDIALATAGDPARRLAGAAQLRDRLRQLDARRREQQRQRADAERLALATRTLERTRARRPWVIATGLTLGLGLTASLWFADRADRARANAEHEAARAQAVNSFLQDLLLNADRGIPGAGHDLTVREALQRGSDALQQRFVGTPLTEATVRLTTGRVFDSLGELETASTHLQRAATLFERELGPSHPQTLASRYQLAITLSNASDYEQAAAVLAAADSDALAAGPNPEAELAAARAWGRWYLLQGRAAEAAPELERAALAQWQLQPDDLQTLHAIRSDQAQAYNHMGRAAEAVVLLQELQQPQYRRAVSPAKQASTDFLLGVALLYAGRYDEAETTLLAAQAALDEIYGEDSVQSARLRSALGNLYFTTGRPAEALPLLSAARSTQCQLYGPQHQACLQHRGNEGIARLQLGDDREARLQLEAAHGGFRERFGDDFTGTQVLAYYLATTLLAAGETEQAATLIDGLDPAILARGSPGAHWEARVRALAATALLLRGQVDKAVGQLREAVTAMEAAQLQPWILDPFREYLRSGEAMLQAANKS